MIVESPKSAACAGKESTERMETVDFIIPTLKRPDHLRRCLGAMVTQTHQPTQVVVGIRSDDSQSLEVVEEFSKQLNLEVADAIGVGVVGSMNSCLQKCSSSFIGLVDDDVELPSHWTETMLGHLDYQTNVIAAAGRDLLMDHPEMRRNESLTEDVGQIHAFGRMTGNHHCGGGTPREVDILRGSNCLFRSSFLQENGFERSLAGSGAQVNWELALALQARKAGYRMFFDPSVSVVHNVAPRYDNDSVHRGVFNSQGTADIAHNETLVVLKHGKGWTRFTLLLWQVGVGSQTCPGVGRIAECLLRSTPRFLPRFRATVRGRLSAVKTLIQGTEHAS